MSVAPATTATAATLTTTRGELLPYVKALATLLKGVRTLPLMREFVVLDGTIGSLWATDYETTIGRCLDIKGERVLVRLEDVHAALKFGGSTKAALARPVKLNVSRLDNGKLVASIACGDITVPVQAKPADDYPDSAHLLKRGDALCELDSTALQSMWKATAWATAPDRDMLPILTAVRWQTERIGNRLEFVATDRFKAAFTDRILWGVERDVTLNVPAVLGKYLPLLIPGCVVSVSTCHRLGIVSTEDGIVVTDNATTIHQRLLEGDFPKVERVIPSSYQSRHNVDRDALLNAAKATLPFVSGSKPAIRLVFEPEAVTTQARPEEGDWFDVGTAHVTSGDNDRSTVGVNPKYFVDSVTALDKGEATIDSSGPGKPLLFTTNRTRIVLMSVRIPEEESK